MSKKSRDRERRSFRRRRAPAIHPGTLPGTLRPPAPASAARPVLTVITFTRDGITERTVASADDIIAAVAPSGITWINVDGLGDPTVLARLGERFGLHPLALEDAVNVPQRPKVERYEKHVFIVLRTMRLTPELEEEQVSIFFGADWVITIQERADGDVFGPVRDAIRQGRGRVREAAADYLAYLLLDAVVDGYFPVLEAVSERLETLQSDAITTPTQDTLLGIQQLRGEILTLRRAIWPIREEMAVLQRDESGLVSAETRVFLRDAYDHAVQALEVIESLRETSASVMEVYLSAQNQRLNQVMKLLTVIATLFIPLTFIASIYGMNFEYMPELRWRHGYPFALTVMALVAAAMLVYFRRRRWW